MRLRPALLNAYPLKWKCSHFSVRLTSGLLVALEKKGLWLGRLPVGGLEFVTTFANIPAGGGRRAAAVENPLGPDFQLNWLNPGITCEAHPFWRASPACRARRYGPVSERTRAARW